MAYVDPEEIAPGPDGHGGLRMPSPGMGGWGRPSNPRKPPLEPEDPGDMPEWLPKALNLMLKRFYGPLSLGGPTQEGTFFSPFQQMLGGAPSRSGSLPNLGSPLDFLLSQMQTQRPHRSYRRRRHAPRR